MTAKWIHDCIGCTLLGQYEGADVYVHVRQAGSIEVIIRKSSEGKEYWARSCFYKMLEHKKEVKTETMKYVNPLTCKRPDFNELKMSISDIVLCSCNTHLTHMEMVRDHWQRGHFDVYDKITE